MLVNMCDVLNHQRETNKLMTQNPNLDVLRDAESGRAEFGAKIENVGN